MVGVVPIAAGRPSRVGSSLTFRREYPADQLRTAAQGISRAVEASGVGGIEIRNSDGGDGSDVLRAEMTDADFSKLMVTMNYEMERGMLRGPSDKDLEALRTDPTFQPEKAIESHKQRVQWELDTVRVLNEHPSANRTEPGTRSPMTTTVLPSAGRHRSIRRRPVAGWAAVGRVCRCVAARGRGCRSRRCCRRSGRPSSR